MIFLVKHVRHRSFFELATVKRKTGKKGVVFRGFQVPEGKLEVNEERETSAFFPDARVSRPTPALCFVRLKSAKIAVLQAREQTSVSLVLKKLPIEKKHPFLGP